MRRVSIEIIVIAILCFFCSLSFAVSEGEMLFNKGTIYWRNVGDIESQKKACEYFEQAASEGYLQAKYNLAMCYRLGRGKAQNLEKAKDIFVNLTLNGNERSILALANITIYEERKCTYKNINIVDYLLLIEDAFLKPYAQFMVGEAYLSNRCVKRDVPLGLKHLENAAESGNVLSQAFLFYIYSGEGELKLNDENKANFWKEKFYSNPNKPMDWEIKTIVESFVEDNKEKE